MINNDILRSIRYTFDFSDKQMMALFAEAGSPITEGELTGYLAKEDEKAYILCPDPILSCFLDGLIIFKRGKRDGAPVKPLKRLTNNAIFMKLKIALTLQADDVLSILALADCIISKHELSAFFRKDNHKHYRLCKDQIMRYFLKGLQIHYRENKR